MEESERARDCAILRRKNKNMPPDVEEKSVKRLSVLVGEYEENQRRLRVLAEATTLPNYLVLLRQFVRWIAAQNEDGKEAMVTDLCPQVFARYIDHVAATKPKKARVARAAVRSFCRYLIRLKWIDADITKDVEMPTVDLAQRVGPSEEIVDQIIATIETMRLVNNVGERKRHVFRACLYLMIFTGLRIKEIAELRTQDIDINKKTVFVRLGKGKHERYVKAPEEFWPVITAYLAQRPVYPGDRLLVYSERHAMGETSSALVLRKIMAAAGIDPANITPHCMRHAFATRAARNGAPLAVIQAQLGHSKITTTAIYIHAPTSITTIEAQYFGMAAGPTPPPIPTPEPPSAAPAPSQTDAARQRRRIAVFRRQ